MPYKRCADCGGQYGNYVRRRTPSERAEWLPCAYCAALRRAKQAREEEQERVAAEDRRQEDLAEQGHRRQRELNQDELERQQEAAKEVCEREIAIKKIEADLQKSQHAAEEEAKIRRYEAYNQREIAQEETKQLQAKAMIAQEETKQLQAKATIAQEETKKLEVKARLEEASTSRDHALEKTKQVELEERTKQMKAFNETLTHSAELHQLGFNKQVIEGVLKNIVGNTGNVHKGSSQCPRTESENKTKNFDNEDNLSPQLPPRINKPRRSRSSTLNYPASVDVNIK